MTMPGFRVTPEMVQGASISCGRTAEEVSQQLGVLRNYVVGLESTWHGLAQDTFQELMASWDRYAQMMHHSLTEIGAGLQSNYVNYAETEGHNVRTLQPAGDFGTGTAGVDLPPSRF
jgi:WXG100 family type VII secretion target